MTTSPKIYIRGLIKATDQFTEQMAALTCKPSSFIQEEFFNNAGLITLQENIQSQAQGVETILGHQSASAANLPIRSRRAYQWLKFLSKENYLQQHLRTLSQLYQYKETTVVPHLKKRVQAQIHLYHFGGLYAIQVSDSLLKIKVHEAFIGATQEQLHAIIKIAYQKANQQDKANLKEFESSESHFAIRQELEYIGIPQGANAKGTCFNLETIFKRINRIYFGNQLEQPRLTWNQQLTYRKFGHYQYSTDTVMISKSLDLPNTPAFVLDYVMYHELLHKDLGYQLINGRRYGHTPEFRKEEGEFNKLQEAKDFLNKLSRLMA